ncbi:M23 family metallopeptidase [Paenibacillus xylanexedens]|uniref:M23 family metallopeptidase n=1 Tax=Paenibacillus xylanexedens TaxID=528191 RepID=UPI0011A3935B|nr:M23 family metallopeptidase [Paenibacillus xylanexedens]
MNNMHEELKRTRRRKNEATTDATSKYVAQVKVQTKKGWRLFAMSLAACMILSACSSNVSSDQAGEQSAEQTSSSTPVVENKENDKLEDAEKQSGTEVQAVITPDNFLDTLLNGSKDEIYSQMSPALKEAVSLEEFKSSADSFLQGVTTLDQVVDVQMNNLTERVWKDATGTKGIRAYFSETQIEGLSIHALEPHEDTDNRFTQTEFQFPMKGDWFVFWGGNDVLSNYHYEHETQRYALDIVRTKDNFSYLDDPTKNENYYAFGEPLYASADGTVVEIKNDIPDNTPGVMNAEEPAGNFVVIDHGNDEYSITAHLKEGSVAVKKGDKVKQGDLIGELGNSGNSSEAHLHFQVSDGADLFTSRSINIRWADQSQQLTRGNTIQAR